MFITHSYPAGLVPTGILAPDQEVPIYSYAITVWKPSNLMDRRW